MIVSLPIVLVLFCHAPAPQKPETPALGTTYLPSERQTQGITVETVAPPGLPNLLKDAQRIGRIGRVIRMISNDSLLLKIKDDSGEESLARFDLHTMSLDRLAKLSTELKRKGLSRSSMSNFHVSPDGRWMLWSDDDYNGRRYVAVIAATDGTKHHVVPIGGRMGIDAGFPNPICWSTELDRWLEFRAKKDRGPTDEIVERRLGDRKARRTIRPAPECMEDDVNQMLDSLKAGSSACQYWSLDWSGGDIHLSCFSIDKGVRLTSDKIVRQLRHDWTVASSWSPLANRLYWLNREGEKSTSHMKLYSLDVQTGAVKTHGYIPSLVYRIGDTGEMHVAWTIESFEASPNGTRICFGYRGELYVAAVNP
jgi:hypothetical protein